MDWETIKGIIEVVAMLLIPVIGWVFHTVTKHGRKLIMLEEKVKDSIQRRLSSLETKVDGIEVKIDNKIDKLEDSIHESQLQTYDKIEGKFEAVIQAIISPFV